MNVYLIGYRGVGKSSVAPALARALGDDWSAIDLDVALERRAGRPIADIFANDGEARFRDLESEILAGVGHGDRLVVATGGGVVLRPTNRDILRQGHRVWLTASVETIAQRLAGDVTTAGRRPALTALGGVDEIRALLAAREPLYRELAERTFATDHASTESLALAIATAWREEWSRPAALAKDAR